MRKLRTRQHFIEDLGFNHIEKQVLVARCTLQRYQPDYSYDASIHTIQRNGEVENGEIFIQLKSTDKIKFANKRKAFTYDLSKRDLELWLSNILPVILILYNAKNDKAYYLELREYFRKNRISLKKINKFIRVYIPPENVFNPEAVKKLRSIKNKQYGSYKSL